MICSNCGQECSESAKYCRFCGAKLLKADTDAPLPIVSVTQKDKANIKEVQDLPKVKPSAKKKKTSVIITAMIALLIIAIAVIIIVGRNIGHDDIWPEDDLAKLEVGPVSSAGDALQIYNDLLSGEGYGEFLEVAGIDYVTTDETYFALAYINNDDIPELVLYYYDDVYVISIYGDSGSAALHYCRCYESWELQELGYYYKNNYITLWEGEGSFMTTLPYTESFGKGARLFEKNDEEDGIVYNIYNYDPTADPEGKEPEVVSEDQFYSELEKTVDVDSYSIMEFYTNTPEERAEYLSE